MNNEQQQIIDESYENYLKEYKKDNSIGTFLPVARVDGKHTYRKLDKEMFIGLCIHDKIFSEKWGLKIEERDLSEEERYDLCAAQKSKMSAISEEDYIKYNIPTKLITIKYNDKKIESYEFWNKRMHV